MDVPKIISNLKYNLLQRYYWYGNVLMQLPVVYDEPGISTMAVGKLERNDLLIKLFVNSEYVEHIFSLCPNGQDLAVNHLTAVLRHEIHHLIFGHLSMEFPIRRYGIIACELAANSYISRSNLLAEEPGKKPGIFPEDFNLNNGLPTWEYYTLLCRLLPQSNNAQGGKKSSQGQENQDESGKSGEGSSQGQGNQENNGKSGEGSSQGQGNQENNGKSGEGSNDAPPSPAGNEEVQILDNHSPWEEVANDPVAQAMVKDIICKANEACRKAGNKWGNIPGDLKEKILLCEEIREPIIPWEVVLKDFLASASETVLDYTMRRPSKRYGTRPGTRKEDILSIAIGIDTSGSIDHEMLSLFFNELEWINKSGNKITVFEWDTRIQREYDFRDFDNEIQGGGGTDPTEFLETVSERNFDCAIVFTDLYFSKITEDYRLPVLWVALTECSPSSFPVEGVIMAVNAARDGFDVIRN